MYDSGMKDPHLKIVKLNNKIISLETKNNFLLMNNRQLKKLREKQLKQEEIDMLQSRLNDANECLTSAERYIEHLEHLLEFFVYKRDEFKYIQIVDNSVDKEKTTV